MSDVIINARVGVSGVNNGAAVVFAQETGIYGRFDPQINQYVSSGTLFSQYDQRFDEYYGGGVGSNIVQNVTTLIASGQSTSAAIDTKGRQLVGIYFPSAFTGGTVTFQGSPAFTGTYGTINQQDSASDYFITVPLNDYQPVDLSVFAGVRYLKIVSTSTEALDRTLTLALKDV